MANEKNLGIALLCDLDMVILERIGQGYYQLYGKPPQFYSWLFPSAADGTPCTEPWLHSPMLDFFLGEAEMFFSSQRQGTINSGIWLEDVGDHGEMPLIATARYVEQMQIITVQRVQEFYEERARILHQARSELLEMERLSSDLATYKAKSLYDALTKLYNRGAFEEMLKTQISSRRRIHTCNLALLMMDIDHFKNINDTFGHLAGDSVLTQMGAVLRDVLRKEDVPARYGGEEFVVMAPNTTREQAEIVAEKIRGTVQGRNFGLGTDITVSVGLTLFQQGESAHSFLGRADEALYMAKNAGRNKVCHL